MAHRGTDCFPQRLAIPLAKTFCKCPFGTFRSLWANTMSWRFLRSTSTTQHNDWYRNYSVGGHNVPTLTITCWLHRPEQVSENHLARLCRPATARIWQANIVPKMFGQLLFFQSFLLPQEVPGAGHVEWVWQSSFCLQRFATTWSWKDDRQLKSSEIRVVRVRWTVFLNVSP